MAPTIPLPRGPLSSAVLAHLTDDEPLGTPTLSGIDPLVDDDFHLALWCCYELHYRGFEGVADAYEWDPATLAFRAILERAFEDALRSEHHGASVPSDPLVALRVIATWAGPPLSAAVAATASVDQLREFAIHRSAYQLKEADGHTFAIPRLHGPGRSALIEIQADEYGHGRPGEGHAELFAAAMEQLGLHAEFGTYVDRLPGTTLATDNLVSMFGLNRRLRGALIGHLALFEMTSVTSMARYLDAAHSIGGLDALERFFEVHVAADRHHAELALTKMVGGFVETEPKLAADVTFGAAALSRVEARFAHHLLASWREAQSSLRPTISDVASGSGAVVETTQTAETGRLAPHPPPAFEESVDHDATPSTSMD